MFAEGPLIGREAEMAELERTFGLTRLLTVTGTGGCGKTRVALALAERVVETDETDEIDKCAIVPLASVESETHLVDALLRALGARERFGSSSTQVLRDHVAATGSLLVLDNCEHLRGPVGRLIEELLDVAPHMRVLATSREPLGIAGESVFPLGPLDLPDPDGGVGAIVNSGAGRLFVDRAVRGDPRFALAPDTARAIAQICRKLDGLPLALGLAAARMDTLSVTDIAEQLSRDGRLATAIGAREIAREQPLADPAAREEPVQHRSMRASLDWSCRLLGEPERVMMRRLAVFSGGFTTAAARAVARPEQSEAQVRESVERLEASGFVARSGQTRAPRRWMMLETIAEYASEQLTRAGGGERQTVADRHCAWFAAYAARSEAQLLEPDGHGQIDSETPNLRRAIEHAIAHDPPVALRIAAGLMCHWILAERFQEARWVCAAVLSANGHADGNGNGTGDGEGEGCRAADGDGDRGGDRDGDRNGNGNENAHPARAVVHCGAGLMGILSEDYARAIEETQRGLGLLDELDEARDAAARATCLRISSMVLIQTGLDMRQGLRNAEHAVELQRGGENPLGLAFGLVSWAVAASLCERYEAVGSAYAQFNAIPKANEHARLRAWAEQAAAWAQVSAGSPRRALEHVESALELEGEWPSMTRFQVIGFRIQALARLGETDRALAEGEEAIRLARESGALQAAPAIELALALAALVHGDLDAAGRYARGLLRMPHVHTLVLARETLARVALVRGDAAEARAHAAELEAIAERADSPRQRALARYLRGCAAVGELEADRGRELLHGALATYAELGLERDATEALDQLALLAARGGEVPRAARLAAAACAARARLQCVASPPATGELLGDAVARAATTHALAPTHAHASAPTHAHAHASARAHEHEREREIPDADRQERPNADGQERPGADGQESPNTDDDDAQERWRAAWAQGEELALSDAIAYARRGRGRRDRPPAGWASLTPAEAEVASLATAGLSNPEIAARLFIARGTVKMHLANVYRKLHVANRVELAAASAARTTT